jgi:purine nucleosidase/pyrimidine-specific ribonucleoside hydrolase
MKRVILDMDPGVDDALAIILALKSPELKIEAITVVSGNIQLEFCVKNALRVLDLLKIDDIPVSAGADCPLKRERVNAPSVHGSDGLGELDRFIELDGKKRYSDPTGKPSPIPAVELILDLVDKFGQDIGIIATGPLTNIAQAIIEDSRTMRKLGELIVMGGAFSVSGNVTSVAEFNAYADPDAVQVVLDSGIRPLTYVGLDVTQKVRLYRDQLYKQVDNNKTKIAQFIKDCTEFYIDFHRDNEGFDGCYLHDPLAVGIAIQPDLVKTQDLFVQVETFSRLTMGMTVADFRPRSTSKSNASVCIEVDADRFMNMFYKLVLS